MTEEKPTPRDDQIADLAYFINNPKAGLLHDPGVGKTVTAAIHTEYRYDYFAEKAVWIQPMSLLDKNRDELLRFTKYQPEDIVIVQGTPAKKLALLRGPGKLWLMTGTGFGTGWRTLLEAHPDIKACVVDEIHLIYAGHTSKRTKEWYEACRHFTSIIPMSGTILKGRLSSAYPMLQVIAPLLYGSYESFMAQHAVYNDMGRLEGWINHEKLRNVLGATCIRRSLESIYGDNHPVVQIEVCDMKKSVRKKYDEFEELGIIELEADFLEAKSKGVAAIRCRQIMGHPETFGLADLNDLTGKDEHMMIHVENHVESGERLVIFAALIPEQERIYRLLKARGLKVALINGLTHSTKRTEIDRQFRAGQLQFIVGSAATMGVGFNWPFLNMVLFASLDYGDDTFTQAYKRGIRGLREKVLLVIVLSYRNSIDQRIFQAIERKAKDYNAVDETKPEIFLRAAKEAKSKTGSAGPLSMDSI